MTKCVTKKLFSIVIPAYKRAFLKKAINSILEQTYANFELIIVDDNSPEDLNSIVSLYNDSRILYYKNKKNCGAIDVVDNWNICLNYAKGDYIICMGDDDMLAPNALEEYAQLIKKYPNVDLFHSRVKRINEQDEFIELTDVRPEYESVLSMIWHRIAYRKQYIGDFLFRTTKLKEVGGFFKLPYAWASDDITGYIVARENGVVHTNNPNFFYRCNQSTITMSGNAEIKMKALQATDEWYANFIANYVPQNIEDSMLKIMIERNLSKYSLRQKNILLMQDMYRSNGKSLFKWLRDRKKFQLSLSLVAFAFISFLKMKKVGARF